MSDQLKISIDVAAAKTALDSLAQSFRSFAQSAFTSSQNAGTAVSKLNQQLRALKPLDASVITSLQALSTAIANMNAGNIRNVADALGKMGGAAAGAQQASQGVQRMSTALRDANAHVKAYNTHIRGLATAQREADRSFQSANSHVKAYAAHLREQETAVRRAAAAQRALSDPIRQSNIEQDKQNAKARASAQTINYLGRELINSAGFMAGFGVTAGNIVESLRQLGQQGATVGTVMEGLRSQFGAAGAAVAAFAAGAVAIKAMATVLQNLLGPVIEVGKEFASFQVTLDSIDGNGAGMAAYEKLGEIAERNALNIRNLTTTFAPFRIATQSAGLAAEDSLKIFEQYSGALRAMGADSNRTKLAFLALTQMYSKGTVTMEELRRQLGDSLPGAFTLAAEAMGVTTQALDAMIRSGSLMATDLVPKLGDLLEQKFGDAIAAQAKNAIGQIELLGNRITAILTSAASLGPLGGLMKGLAAGLHQVNDALNSDSVYAMAAAFGDLAGVLSASILGVLGGIVNGLTAFTDAVLGAAKAIASVIPFGEELYKVLTENNYIMNSIGGVAGALGTVIGALIGPWIALRIATISYNTAIQGAGLAMSAIGGLVRALGFDFSNLTKAQILAAGAGVTTANTMQRLQQAFATSKLAVAGFVSGGISLLGTAFAGIGKAAISAGNAVVTFGRTLASGGIIAGGASVLQRLQQAWVGLRAAINATTLATIANAGAARASAAASAAMALGARAVATAMQAYAAGTLLASARAATLRAGKVALTGAMTALVPVITGVARAMVVLNSILSKNPFMRIVQVIGLMVGAYGAARTAMQGYTAVIAKVVGESKGVSDINTIMAKSFDALGASAKKNADSFISNAESHRSYSEMQKRAKQEIDVLKMAIEGVDQSLANHKRSIEETKEGFERYNQGAEWAIKSTENWSKRLEQTDKRHQRMAQGLGEMGASAEGAGQSFSNAESMAAIYAARIDAAKQRTDELKSSLDLTKASQNDTIKSMEQGAASFEKRKADLEAQIASLEKWGIALGQSGTALAEEAMKLGMVKDKATQLAAEYERLMMTKDELRASDEQEIARLDKQAQLQLRLSDEMKKSLEPLQQKLDATGKLTDVEQRQYDQLLAFVSARQQEAATIITSIAGIEALKTARDEERNVTDTLSEAIEKTAEKYGISVEAAAALASGLDNLTGSQDKSKTATEKAADASGKLNESASKTAGAVRSSASSAAEAAKNIGTLAGAVSTASSTIGSANGAISALADATHSIAESSIQAEKFLPMVATSIAALGEAVVKAVPGFESLSILFTDLTARLQNASIVAPEVAVAIGEIGAQASAAFEPIQSVTDALTRFEGMDATITATKDAYLAFAEAVAEAQEVTNKFSTAMEGLETAIKRVLGGFETFKTEAKALISALDSIGDAVQRLIGQMEALETAAKRALEAANRAKAAGGDGNSSGGREGGYSEDVGRNSTSLLGSGLLNNAPQFAQGTANTSRYSSKLPGGGIPSILHPNEAVVPLSKGRKIPVDVKMAPLTIPKMDMPDMSALSSPLMAVSKSLQAVSASLDAMSTAAARTPPMPSLDLSELSVQPAPAAMEASRPRARTFASSDDGLTPGPSNGTRNSNQNSNNETAPINITVNVQAADLDSFRKSEDQIAREISSKLVRATRRV